VGAAGGGRQEAGSGGTFVLGLRSQLTVLTVEFSLATKVTEPLALSFSRSRLSLLCGLSLLLALPLALLASRPRAAARVAGGGGGGGGGGCGLGGRPRYDLRGRGSRDEVLVGGAAGFGARLAPASGARLQVHLARCWLGVVRRPHLVS
jgi:hypothetical protein